MPIFANFILDLNLRIMKRIFLHGLLLLALIFGAIGHSNAQSTLVVIFLNDGTEYSCIMTESERIYFENKEILVIESIEKGTVRFNLADIRKITCEDYVGTEENADLDVAIYPNPVHETLTLRHLSGTQTVSIYALDGRLVKSFEASEGQAIGVGELPVGLYFVKTQSSTLKMIKL